MLKHCQATAADSTRRSRRSLLGASSSETASLNSSTSSSMSSSTSGSHTLNSSSFFLGLEEQEASVHHTEVSRRSSYSSPEPISLISRTSSFASLSLNDSMATDGSPPSPKIPIKIFAKCLRPDIEYKTLVASAKTTSREIIWQLLSKVKMRHRDRNLFYLTMDITIKRTGIPLQRTLILEDDAHPAELKSCHPWGDCRFSLQTRKGGLVRVHDSVLMSASKYKCLLIAEHTTVEEVIKILFHCYGLERIECVDRFAIYEQCQSQCYERRLHPADRPAQVQSLWPNPSQFMFVLRREGNIQPHVVPALSSAGSRMVSNSAGVSPVSSDAGSSTSESPVPSEASYGFQYTPGHSLNYNHINHPQQQQMQQYHHLLRQQQQPQSLPMILPSKMQPLASIHESGLPDPPPLRPKPILSAGTAGQGQLEAILAAARGTRASSTGSTSVSSCGSGGGQQVVSFHEYENYFYI